jgi:hypothetical protein
MQVGCHLHKRGMKGDVRRRRGGTPQHAWQTDVLQCNVVHTKLKPTATGTPRSSAFSMAYSSAQLSFMR